MNIDPLSVHNHLLERPIIDPEVLATDRAQIASALQPSGTPDPLAALQRQFTGFVKGLMQQLAALEKQFTSVLKQLATAFAEEEKSHIAKSPIEKSNATKVVKNQKVPASYRPIVTKAAQRYQLDPALIGAVMYQESGFRNNAVSSAGASGLMQLMPETARSLGVSDPFNPEQNINGGAQLLRQLLDRYDGKVDLALAAYNAGTAAVDKYGGIPPFRETQNYVQNVLAAYRSTTLTTAPA